MRGAGTLICFDAAVLLGLLTPPQHRDDSSVNETMSTIGGLSVLFVVVLACIQLRSLRREVYGGQGCGGCSL
jgi:hypothetical protein